ncbi:MULTISPECIES: acyl-CoA dehydrogenase family protein [Spongiibacter]|uniref:acyl-CoA dehydrogenase family protein n=1 Tax=Spongiibacter TaxID=630749 RepID=UPI00258076B6|nr:acyl-CoA dehydrogenase family protein [Spongiibacter sp. UBA1325]MEE2651865.1 acyl-CoA dehydrogenase family protein [Pseudomonadota bacterium]|tara:strand:+ start:440 stop:1603 length:1164 start_codon:yes stop_codon:yes gene_type:complete
MKLDRSEDQTAVADLVRGICEDHCTTDIVRQMEDDAKGYHQPFWDALRETGLMGTFVAEELGGTPVSMLENAAMYEEFGRALAPSPHFGSSVLAALVLADQEEMPSSQRLLTEIASGELIIAPAWLETGGGFEPEGVQLRAEKMDDGVRLNGSKRHVFFASAAQKLLVLARSGDAPEAIDLFLVDRSAPGVSLKQELSMASDTQYLVQFDNVDVAAEQCVSVAGTGWDVWHRAVMQGLILEAARAVGLAQRALEITVQYAQDREQFGKPIGAFQAIGHYLADCSTEIDGARLLVQEAAWAHANGQPYETLAAAAKLFACKVAREVTAKAEQIHGGIGFTMEYDIQLFFRRAKQQQLNWLDSRRLEDIVAAAVLDSDDLIAVADPFAA